MSSFLKKGKRIKAASDKKEVKKRVKAVYAKLNELHLVAEEMKLHQEEVNEDNIEEIASNYTDMKLDGFEKFILLGKMNIEKDEIKDN